MVIINDDFEEEKSVSHVSSAVTDPLDSETPEMSQNLSAAGMKGKGVDKDPEVVESSSKKKMKKKNKNGRRKNQSEEPLKNNTDSDNGGSSSQNSGNYPQFNLDDYLFAREEDINMMKMVNEYNRRNHAIITEQGFDGVSDRQLENLVEHLMSIGQMLRKDKKGGTKDEDNNNNNNKNKKNKIWCPRCHRLARTCGC